jgi:hypothetical protein
MSLREKRAWISLAITLFVFVPYFSNMLGPLARHEADLGAVLPLFLGAVILEAALIIFAEIVVAILSRDEKGDERDRAIAGRAHRIAYHVLSISATSVLLGLVALSAIPEDFLVEIPFAQAEASAFLSQVLFLCLIVAEVVRNTTEVFYYRRGS